MEVRYEMDMGTMQWLNEYDMLHDMDVHMMLVDQSEIDILSYDGMQMRSLLRDSILQYVYQLILQFMQNGSQNPMTL